MSNDQELRKQLVKLLTAQQTHMLFVEAVKDFPEEHINTRPLNVEYTFWQLVEHIRFNQWDVLDYIRNPNYKWLDWPDDYWPERDAVTDKAGWDHSIQLFMADRKALVEIIKNPATDLYAQIPHGFPGHNVLREILVAADHSAYHIGELGILRGSMGLWNK